MMPQADAAPVILTSKDESAVFQDEATLYRKCDRTCPDVMLICAHAVHGSNETANCTTHFY